MKNKFLIISLLTSAMLIGCNQNNNSSIYNSMNSNNNSSVSISSSDNKDSSTSISKPSRPHTHKYEEWEILEEADLFNKGKRIRYCEGCDLFEKEEYYDLSEVRFTDKTYQYNGLERQLTIDGILPKGISVKYKNNKLTEIGTIISTAEFIDENNKVIESREAILTITPYKGLPAIRVKTINEETINSKEVYTDMTLSIDNCEETFSMKDVIGGIRLRGNGSLEAIKKPYRIKFDEKQSMLGLNDNAKAKSWVLLAEFYDYSLMRNATAFTLGDNLMNGQGYYASDFQHVNLYINDIFNGIYVLAEQQQVNKNRVNIYEPEENEFNTDIGYLLEMDNYGDDYPFDVGNSSFMATDENGNRQSLPIRTYSIKSDIYSLDQQEYIKKYMNSVYSIMYNAICLDKYYSLNGNLELIESVHKDAYSTINEVINIDSLIRSYILEEIIKDVDVGFSSYYMFVDFSKDSKFKKLTFGAPWDFDWSSGNVGSIFNHEYNNTNGGYNSIFTEHMNPWLFLISQLDNFNELASDYWMLIKNSGVFENMVNQINDIAITYKNDFNLNFQKWDVLGKTSGHVYHCINAYNVNSQEEAANYLASWLNSRISYLNTVWQS